jgi:Transposase IS116/IS110/IS902 family
VARRAHIVRQRTRLKNQVQAVLHRNLIPRCPAADLFGNKGRAWLAQQRMPADERQAVVALLRQLDFHGQELALIDRELAKVALGCQDTKRLMTIPGVDVTVAMSITSAVGDFSRFSSPDKLVSYLGLNPRIKQSGGQPASHGRITKQGRAHARGMLVEAAWVAVKTPGPLRAFYERVRSRRGMQIAVVATARKLCVLCWHMITRGEDYAFARPSLTAKKLRALQLKAGHRPRRGQKGSAAGYSLKDVRAREKQMAEHAERAYRQLVADWQAKAPANRWAWPPPTGRDSQRPPRGKLRGSHQSHNLRFAAGSTTPTTHANATQRSCRCRAALDTFIRASELAPVVGREGVERQHVVLGLLEHRGDLGQLASSAATASLRRSRACPCESALKIGRMSAANRPC